MLLITVSDQHENNACVMGKNLALSQATGLSTLNIAFLRDDRRAPTALQQCWNFCDRIGIQAV